MIVAPFRLASELVPCRLRSELAPCRLVSEPYRITVNTAPDSSTLAAFDPATSEFALVVASAT